MNIVFNGECVGVHLTKRAKDDNHVMVSILVEDNETWFKKVEVSSYWIDEMIDELQKAKKYMKENCSPDLDAQSKQWGYTFKEESK